MTIASKTRPDFSVITANLNGARYLGDCLQSVASQKGVTVEHLVMDGGSTDESEKVVSRFPGVVFHQEADSGMSEAINRGFRRARGDWVMWLNSDDCLKNEALAKVLAFVSREEKAEVVYGGWDFVDQNRSLQKRMSVFPFRRMMLAHLGCYIGSTACFLKRKSTIGEGHFLNSNFQVVMDGEYYCRLARAGKHFSYLAAILAEFRLHGENTSFRRYQKEGVEGHLALQKQWAEGAAIRREYGVSLFHGEHANGLVDAAFYYFFLVQKAILKRTYRILRPLR